MKLRVCTKYVTLAFNAGFLCVSRAARERAGIECLIDNCHIYADLLGAFQNGFVGADSFNKNTGNSKITLQNCSFTGDIHGTACAGFVGYGSFTDNTDIALTIKNCHFIGDIYGLLSCGIAGTPRGIGPYDAFSFGTNTNAVIAIHNCSFTGNIGGAANGGLFIGPSFLANTSSIITVDNCNIIGNIYGEFSGGIVGFFFSFIANQQCSVTICNCGFTGNMTGLYNGGIFGFNNFIGNNGGSITINNCCASGRISGSYCSGLVGASSFVGFSDGITIENTSKNTVQNCYSFCNYTANAFYCGGILGPGCGYLSSPILVKDCYSTGTIIDPTSYAILGYDEVPVFIDSGIGCTNCNVLNCVYNSSYGTIAGPDYDASFSNPDIHNTYQGTFGTINIAGSICDPNNAQIIYTPYKCQLHTQLLDKHLYQKKNKNLKVLLVFSICEPIAICDVLIFVLKNKCKHDTLYIYSKDMKFESRLYWCDNALYNGTLASGTYIIAAKK